ncbi:MAG: hypothetical protein ACI8XO_000775 [Verrucomicrobiales bacterium]|jgi:hypothetical protein
MAEAPRKQIIDRFAAFFCGAARGFWVLLVENQRIGAISLIVWFAGFE